MSKAYAASEMIGATTDHLQLLDYLLAISSGITPSMLMKCVEKLSDPENAMKIGSLSIGASMNIRRVINDLRTKVNINLNDEWLINQEINFTMFAMLGHILFMLPESELTAYGVGAKKVYMGTIGGAANITEFKDASKLEGKEERAKILLKWSGMLAGLDVMKYKNLLARKFPHIVKNSGFTFGPSFSSFWSLLSSPFSSLYQLMKYAVSFIVPVIRFILFLSLAYMTMFLVTKYAIPDTSKYIATSFEIASHAPQPSFGPEAFLEAGFKVPGFATRFSTSIPSLGVQAFKASGTLGIMVVRSLPNTYTALRNVYDTSGDSFIAYTSSGKISEDVTTTFANVYDVTSGLTGTITSIVTGEKAVNVPFSVFIGTVAELPSTIAKDLEWILDMISGEDEELDNYPAVLEEEDPPDIKEELFSEEREVGSSTEEDVFPSEYLDEGAML